MRTEHPSNPLRLAFILCALLLLSAGLSAQQEATTQGATAPGDTQAEAAAPADPNAKPQKPTYSNKWRLQFSGNAESDGAITLKLIPKEGDPVQTETPIKKGTSENNVAKELVKSLKAQLDKKVYHVERDDGEDVLIKKKYGAKDFDVQVVAVTAKNVRISRQKE